MSYIATANKHEDDVVALPNNDVYFADLEYYKRQHWLRKNNQYIDITDKIGEDTTIISANNDSSQMVSFNKSNQKLSLLNANDFSEVKHWTLPGNSKLAAVRGNKIAVIFTELSNQQNQLMILHTNSDQVVKSTIDTPLAIAWYDDNQLIVHSKYGKYLLLDSDSNTYSNIGSYSDSDSDSSSSSSNSSSSSSDCVSNSNSSSICDSNSTSTRDSDSNSTMIV